MSQPRVNSMGIPLDDFRPTEVPPAIALYGPPGVGKSAEMARAFPNVLYVQTQADILRYADDFSRKNPKWFPRIPQDRVTLDERTVNATLGTVLKYREDQERTRQHGIADLVKQAFDRGFQSS